MPGDLPFIDAFDATIDASAPAVYEALTRHLARSLGSPSARLACGILGCAHRGASLSTPPSEGQEMSGFVVAEAKAPHRLVLEGRHRFASYRLSFTLDPLAPNRTQLTARTEAVFPGFTGAVYRALVIGSGGHEIVARRMLSAVARRAERMESGGVARSMSTPRFELSPTTRFADRASDYALFRPSYPAAAIDAALEGLPDASPIVAADIGAGTGISSRLLADRGVRVFAVEPNAAMRESAVPHPGVTFVDGTAEGTGLGASSVDLVLCAQAFHWFKPAQALIEFRRIVKPRGRFVFLVNERDGEDPAMRTYNAAIKTAAERELSEGMRASVDEALRTEGLATTPASFPHTQALSRDGLVGRARSASYVPRDGPRYERLLRDLDALWNAHRDEKGFVTLGYRTFVWVVEIGLPRGSLTG